MFLSHITQMFQGILHKDLKPEHIWLATTTATIKQQGISDQVAAGIEAPKRSSNRVVDEAKWPICVRSCESNPMDYKSPF